MPELPELRGVSIESKMFVSSDAQRKNNIYDARR